MILSCKCLNVFFVKHSPCVLPFKEYSSLSNSEKEHEFFKNLKLGCINSAQICTEHSFLIQVLDVNSWLIYRCLNCLMYTHASSRSKSEFILVNRELKMMTGNELSALKESDDYSSAFRIIIPDVNDAITAFATENKMPDLCSKLKGLNEKAIFAVQNKVKENILNKEYEIEDRIRQFTEEQYSELKEYKERAQKDSESLIRLLISRNDYIQKIRPKEIVPDVDDGNFCLKSVPDVKENDTQKKCSKDADSSSSDDELEFARNIPPSYDCEGLFPLDGLESPPPVGEEYHSREESSDTEDSGSNDEGIHIPRRKSVAIARSLPIRVPMDFDPSYHWLDETKASRHFKNERRERPMDIAANIKALANSVHGEALFGDLPPPRIGSRI